MASATGGLPRRCQVVYDGPPSSRRSRISRLRRPPARAGTRYAARPPPMSLRRLRLALVSASVAFLVCFLFSSRASAQIVVQHPESLTRVGPDNGEVHKRDINFKPEGVSFQDCIDNQGIVFTLAVTMPEANASLQAWGS